MPASLIFFAFAAIIFILQLIPVIGIFLMIMLAPFWSIALVNAGFAGIGVEAALGKVRKAWLLLPLAWFVGYTVLAAQSRQETARVGAEIARANSQGRLTFDPAKDSLIAGDGRVDMPSVAGTLVARYDLPVAYEPSQRIGGLSHSAHRFGVGATCDRMRERLKDSVDTNFGVSNLRENRKDVPGGCLYFLPEVPGARRFTTTQSVRKWSSKLSDFDIATIRITGPGGETVSRAEGKAGYLGYFPMPVLGCALISSGPSWSCFAGFHKQEMRLPGPEGKGEIEAKLIASALGLAPSIASQRIARSSTTAPAAPASVEGAFASVEALAVKKLEQVLARDPAAADYTMHDMTPIRDKPHLWRGHMERMASFFTANFNRRSEGRMIPEVVSTLFDAMPAEDFRRFAPALAEAIRQRPVNGCEDGRLVLARIGELGPAALPAIEAVANGTTGRACLYLLRAICRVGPPAERLLPFVQVAFDETGSHQASHVFHSAYRALLRLGRADLVRPRVGTTRGWMDKALRSDVDTITPKSPVSVCT